MNTGWESFVHPFIDETTFTPVLEFGGGTTGITYAAQVGRVWQVGMFKFLQINIVLTSKGSSTGVATITGVSTAATRTCFFNTRWSLINLAASYSTTICLISASTVTLQQVGDNVAFVDLTNAEFANTSQLFFTGIYI